MNFIHIPFEYFNFRRFALYFQDKMGAFNAHMVWTHGNGLNGIDRCEIAYVHLYVEIKRKKAM